MLYRYGQYPLQWLQFGYLGFGLGLGLIKRRRGVTPSGQGGSPIGLLLALTKAS